MANLSLQGQGAIVLGTVSVDPASLTTLSETDTSVTIASAKVGDVVIMNPPAAGLTSGIEMCGSWVSAAGTVKIRFRNNTGGTIDQAAVTFNYALIRA